MSQTLCLNMIVKNESHIIVQTLTNICTHLKINYWVICDTGSDDNTKELIIDFFKERNINGELLTHQWKDFGHNRTLALSRAYNKTDFLFIFDADDQIIGNLVLPYPCEADSYSLKFGNEFIYYRPLLINNRKRWIFKGVLHEFLCNIDGNPIKNTIEGDYYINSGRNGYRSKNPNKYLDDADVLKKAYHTVFKTDNGLACRYAFYCAQSFRDANKIHESIEWYKKCLELQNWNQEKYYSCLMIGDLYMKLNDINNSLKYWYKTVEYDSERIEGIINAIKYLNEDKQYLLINALYYKFKNYTIHFKDKLFINYNSYCDILEFYNAVSAHYINDKESGYECCKKIFLNNKLSYDFLKIIISIFKYYIDIYNKDLDNDKLKLFYSIDNIINNISLKNEKIDNNIITIWHTIFDICKPLLCSPTKTIIINKSKINIMITFTTCKRLNLFKQTVYSIINHWNDINKINLWYAVDDNSSQEERNEMITLFPWIQFYMKTEQQKGHRISMNIIWNRLNQIKPNYWIHMEDDFIFYKKMNYIDFSINALTSKYCIDNNVKQILFNRNYAETIHDYEISGHICRDEISDIVLHKHCNGNFNYLNCHYWPHYSFRPSIIETSAILSLGNYDSVNVFFELDYAYKWTKSGLTSAFLNSITSRHIGRLTKDRHSKIIPNAYELNNQSQFENYNKIKIINLEKRIDRKTDTVCKLNKSKIETNQYEFIKGIDGSKLKPTCELKKLFEGNDFGNRKGVIGCALSHLNLWKELINDKYNDYYIIMEDDFNLRTDFKEQIDILKKNDQFSKRNILFLGYHMFDNVRREHFDKYNSNSHQIHVDKLNKVLYIGGTFCYSINKSGARVLIDYIENNGIRHGIDYLIKIVDNLESYECFPQLVFSVWNEGGKEIDSDIQNKYDSLDFSEIETSSNIIASHLYWGKLGNLFFINMALHFISIKNNLHVEYQFYDKLKKLGIDLFIGKNKYPSEISVSLSDDNFYDLIIGEVINKNVSIVNNLSCQTSEFALFLRKYYDQELHKNNIINCNKFKERYNNNNDIFIHVRLGDISNSIYIQTIDYYDKILRELTFNNGYISSDSIDNIICKVLIIKYKLTVINYNDVETIMFATTCKNVILSTGTFSWLIGFLAYYSNIFFPKIIHKCHGDIFIFKNWKQIDWNPDFILDVYEFIFKNDYIFIENLDEHGNDIYFKKVSHNEKFIIAYNDVNCVAFNTLGFFKNTINIHNLKPSVYFKKGDGLYVKRLVYENQIQKNKNPLRIKMLCNWTDSYNICKEWSNMCEYGFIWKNYQLVWTDIHEDIDYYVIINFPPKDSYFVPSKTIIFQMEPWVNDITKKWGVKTWGKWSDPNPTQFLAVRGRKTDHHNNGFWQLETKLNEFSNNKLFIKNKGNTISSICSSKYFDEGHIARIDFLNYLETKENISLDIWSNNNEHKFKNYRGPLYPYVDKGNGLYQYKYYFMVENNYEQNFITEKLWEPILCEALVFYYGCPNVSDYIDTSAFVLLDMNDFEKSYQIINKAIKEDYWSQRIGFIRNEKQKLLNQLAFFPTIDKIIKQNNQFYQIYHSYFTGHTIEPNKPKKYCFIHSCYIENIGIDILNKLISNIVITRLIEHFEKIFIINIGKQINEDIFSDHKIKIINYSNDINLCEIPTINLIRIFCEYNNNCEILYLHTKGITHPDNNKIKDWTDMMLYFLVHKHNNCFKLLQKYDAIGCNYQLKPYKHFSGNFWWSKSNHIKYLDIIPDHFDRFQAEWWICSKNNHNTFEIHNSNVSHYDSHYPRNKYIIE